MVGRKMGTGVLLEGVRRVDEGAAGTTTGFWRSQEQQHEVNLGKLCSCQRRSKSDKDQHDY